MYILEIHQLIPDIPDFGICRRVKVSQQYFIEDDKDKAVELYREANKHLPTNYESDLLHIVEGHEVPITEVS